MTTHLDLVDEANKIDHKYHEAVRVVAKDFRRKFRLAAKARKEGETAKAKALSDEAKALQEGLKKTTIEWQNAHDQLNALFRRDDITEEVAKALRKAAGDAQGHLDAHKTTKKRLDALAKFATFLERTVTTIAKLVD